MAFYSENFLCYILSNWLIANLNVLSNSLKFRDRMPNFTWTLIANSENLALICVKNPSSVRLQLIMMVYFVLPRHFYRSLTCQKYKNWANGCSVSKFSHPYLLNLFTVTLNFEWVVDVSVSIDCSLLHLLTEHTYLSANGLVRLDICFSMK